MNIAIIGSGNVGGTLGERWAKLGHHLVFGTRNPDGPKILELLARAGANARAASLEDAVRDAEVVVISLPWEAVESTMKALDLKGKIVFDCTNPLKADLSGLSVCGEVSGGENVARWASGASVVKIFNTTGFGNMANPVYDGKATAMFLCGGDDRAKAAAKRLAGDLGFEPVDAGPIENARLLEPLAMLWIWLAVKGGSGINFAFDILRR